MLARIFSKAVVHLVLSEYPGSVIKSRTSISRLSPHQKLYPASGGCNTYFGKAIHERNPRHFPHPIEPVNTSVVGMILIIREEYTICTALEVNRQSQFKSIAIYAPAGQKNHKSVGTSDTPLDRFSCIIRETHLSPDPWGRDRQQISLGLTRDIVTPTDRKPPWRNPTDLEEADRARSLMEDNNEGTPRHRCHGAWDGKILYNKQTKSNGHIPSHQEWI